MKVKVLERVVKSCDYYIIYNSLRIGRGTSGPGTTTNDVQSDGV